MVLVITPALGGSVNRGARPRAIENHAFVVAAARYGITTEDSGPSRVAGVLRRWPEISVLTLRRPDLYAADPT